jgi:hypothetical protein
MYVLACGHVVLSAPSLVSSKLGIWCPTDHAELRVKGIHVYEWRAKCLNCTFSRWCGTSETLAETMANSHARSIRHRVKTEYVANPSALEESVRLTRMKVI